jgi:hypothetical protein
MDKPLTLDPRSLCGKENELALRFLVEQLVTVEMLRSLERRFRTTVLISDTLSAHLRHSNGERGRERGRGKGRERERERVRVRVRVRERERDGAQI